eukprot:2596499-Amphidinium_carterae.1
MWGKWDFEVLRSFRQRALSTTPARMSGWCSTAQKSEHFHSAIGVVPYDDAVFAATWPLDLVTDTFDAQ